MSRFKDFRMNLIRCVIICCVCISIFSCAENERFPEFNIEAKTTQVAINVATVADQAMTRADYSPRTDKSMVRTIDVLLANRENVVKRIRMDSETGKVDAANLDATGLVEGLLPVFPQNGVNTGLKLRIGVSDMKDITDIYLVANYISEETHDLAPLLKPDHTEIKTVSELNAIRQGYPNGVEAGSVCTMFGHISMLNQPVSSNDSIKNYNVALERTLSMITLAIDGSDLDNGVVITPISAKLVNVPEYCTINGANQNKADETNRLEEGNSIVNLNNLWGPVCNSSTAEKNGEGSTVVPRPWPNGIIGDFTAPNGPHGTNDMDGKVLPLFMFENMQGTYEPGSNPSIEGKSQITKAPAEANKDNCTYIEVLASYRYSKTLGGNASWLEDKLGNITGNIIYRFYMGADVERDFNIERNKHYMLTLKLGGFGGLRENGNVDADGNWIPNPSDWSWRVDATFSNSGIADKILEVPAAGSVVEVLLGTWYAGVGNKVHISYDATGSKANKVWLKNKNGTWSTNPSRAKLTDYMIPNGDGTYTLKIYVMPLGKDDFERVGSPLTTVERWIQEGKVEYGFSIIGGTSAQNTSFKVVQWLPMPVMNPADVGLSTNPNDAKLYFSRFDLDHGTAFPWCHQGFHDFNMWTDALVTDASALNIWQTWDAVGTPQTYDRTVGFHKTVAYYRTNLDKNMVGQIEFNDGTPNTVMAYAFFTAANAELADNVPMFVEQASDVKVLTHYGIPSVEEWEKIEKYGVYDYRYPLLAGMQYWTSTINGSPAENGKPAIGGDKTMVYMLGTGKAGATPKDRNCKYPARLVYTKDSKATRND